MRKSRAVQNAAPVRSRSDSAPAGAPERSAAAVAHVTLQRTVLYGQRLSLSHLHLVPAAHTTLSDDGYPRENAPKWRGVAFKPEWESVYFFTPEKTDARC